MSSNSLQFNESDGTISNVLSVEKQDKTLQTEVDIPLQIVIGVLTAVNGNQNSDWVYQRRCPFPYCICEHTDNSCCVEAASHFLGGKIHLKPV